MVIRFPIRAGDGSIGQIGGFHVDITPQKRAEAELRASEARLSAFMSNAPIGMFVKGMDGRYEMANPEMARVIGRPVAKVLGATAADVFPSDTAAFIADYDRELLRTGAAGVHEHHLAGREAYAWIMSIRFPIRDHDGAISHIGGFAVDITLRKAMEEALKASEQQFRVLAEAHPVPLFIVRLDDGRIMVATPPCEALLRMPLDAADRRLDAALLRRPRDQRQGRGADHAGGLAGRPRGAVPPRRRQRVLGLADLAAAGLRGPAGDGRGDRRSHREQAHRGRARPAVGALAPEREALGAGLAARRRRARAQQPALAGGGLCRAARGDGARRADQGARDQGAHRRRPLRPHRAHLSGDGAQQAARAGPGRAQRGGRGGARHRRLRPAHRRHRGRAQTGAGPAAGARRCRPAASGAREPPGQRPAGAADRAAAAAPVRRHRRRRRGGVGER